MFTLMEGKHKTKEASKGETLLLTPPPSKSRPEIMPKAEFENLLRLLEASRRKERGMS